MCASIFLMIASAVERYLAVCRPHHYRQVGLGSIEIQNLNLNFKIPDQRSSLEGICLHSTLCRNCFPNKYPKEYASSMLNYSVFN